MSDFFTVDYKANVRQVVRRRLKELGIKAPKVKARLDLKHLSNEAPSGLFGVPLDKLPSKNVGINCYCSVPRFLVEATHCLENHLGSEGLFRKSGSSLRQKHLKKIIEEGGDMSQLCDAQPHDVASLIKQFFRELPEPLLTNQLHDSFLKCLLLNRKNEQTMAALLLCIMLPNDHLATLQYLMKFVTKVASKAEESKMGVSNLSIVLTPNLMNSSSKKENSSNSEKLLKDQTSIIEMLLQNAAVIGTVPGDILHEARNLENHLDGGLSSGDELDGERPVARPSRHRTASITGFVSGFGNKVNKLRNSSRTQSTHRRSKSVKAEFSRQKQNIQVDIKSKDDSLIFTKHTPTGALDDVLNEGKRKPLEREVDKDLTPAGKRKITSKDVNQCYVISSPFSVTRSTQMFMTPRRPIQRNTPLSENVLNSKHARVLATHEDEHVKVVDARHYDVSQDVSPEALHPGAISLEFTKLLEHTPTGDKYVFDSPLDAALSSASLAKSKRAQAKRHGRSRANRRNSSGATRCFSSSPRSRKGNKKNAGKGPHSTSEYTQASNTPMTVGEQSKLLQENPWYNPAVEKGTPRRNTPPVPNMAGKTQFRTTFSENVF